MYRLATKRTEKTNRRKHEREFFEIDNRACTDLVTYCCLFTDFVNCWTVTLNGQAWVDCGLSLGAFINSTRWIRSCIPSVRKLVTETGLIVCQYNVRRTQYDWLSQQQLRFMYENQHLINQPFYSAAGWEIGGSIELLQWVQIPFVRAMGCR